MAMDFNQCVAFVRKYASKSEFHGLTQAPSKQYGKTKINLTYYSMPDWLAVISAARWPQWTGSAEEPIRDVLGAMAMESDIAAVLGFMKLLAGQPIEPATLFPQLVLAYRTAVNQHQNSVAGYLDGFTGWGSGKALLAELGRKGRSVTVMPHWHHFIALPGEGYRNASQRGIRAGQKLSHVIEGIDLDDKDAFAKGALIKNNFGGDDTGTGKGANSIVFYSAGAFTDPRFIDGRMTDATVGEAGFQADVSLYHELAHATRALRGKETRAPVEGPPDFGNIEEYFATVLANIYLSETRPGAPLRGVYGLPAHPTKGWSEMKNPDGFYDNADKLSTPPRELMDTFLATQKEFYGDLAALPTPPKFNPPREHFERAQRLRAISNQRIPI
ncbi:MAG: hypothetical protein JOY90_27255 [Bradyrhizobium sp.]|uniref:hypothetical protein n=1 Tax=Bradyrhizobium sp. TaxID=376 RepID=UPI001E1A1D2A|nr:hypothetical protein [Bradyrhizobium sp.]MBV9564112.1 hypothetical protein [Bradyrhizobium sp.]